jgi:hypothetical protein
VTEGMSVYDEEAYYQAEQEAEMMDHYDAMDAASLIDRLGPAEALEYINQHVLNPVYNQILAEVVESIKTGTYGEGVEL